MAQVHAGAGRNDTGLWLFTQARDNGFSKAEASEILPSYVDAANAATAGREPYSLSEAKATLASAYSRPQREPWRQGDGGAAEPGAGLVQELAREILKEHHFARDEGGLLYSFQDGVYRPVGERVVQCAV
ncbi:MAG: hypothetical protein NTV52_00675, partial [Acidobacteria bacterium]|nr:hypothetical protein [Acidobacteriota bacterium]